MTIALPDDFRDLLGRDALVKNKLASGRHRDLADVEALQNMKR